MVQKNLNYKVAFWCFVLLVGTNVLKAQTSATFVSAYGYDSCIELRNAHVQVILEPNAGGRVIRYSLNGVNILYEDSTQNGWISTSGMPRVKGHIAGGRFDIGPSRIKPNTDLFFFGKWKAFITGESSAKLVSQTDASIGMYLIRDFTLDSITSRFVCKQTIVNSGVNAVSASFWSRTFAVGNGICVLPVPKISRFPSKYVMFMNRDTINLFPRDSNIVQREGCLVIKGPPQKPKLEMDVSTSGWIAYMAVSNVLFVKKFSVFNDKRYGDVTAANASIWYNGVQMTEIEPIGPLEDILPGEKRSFCEEWHLLSFPFPSDRIVNIGKIQQLVEQLK